MSVLALAMSSNAPNWKLWLILQGENNGATHGMWKHPGLHERDLKLQIKESQALQKEKLLQCEPARENQGKKKKKASNEQI